MIYIYICNIYIYYIYIFTYIYHRFLSQMYGLSIYRSHGSVMGLKIPPLPDRSLKHLAALTGPPGGTYFAKLQTRQLNVYLRRMGPLGEGNAKKNGWTASFFLNTSSKCGDVQNIFFVPSAFSFVGRHLDILKGEEYEIWVSMWRF